LIVPEWREDPEPELTQEEYEDWAKTMLKLSVEVIALAIIELAPTGGSASGEYLQGVKNSFVNNFKVLGTITKYFGNNKYVKYLQEARKAIKESPTIEKTLKGWDKLISTFGFNYGMSVFKRGIYKLFPGQEAKIDSLLLIYSSIQFIKDPAGTINALIDTVTSLMKGQLPDRENFEKLFIFDPVQD